MLVVSYLSVPLLPRLTDAIRDIGAGHIQTSSWEEVDTALRHSPRSVLVLDPLADGTNRAEDIAALLQEFPTAPVIVYTDFTPAALQAMKILAPYGVYETILFQIEDSRPRFSRLLFRAAAHSLVVRILDELRPECRRLSPSLADAVDDLFRRPHAYTSGRDLILTSRTPSTSLQRSLAAAGLAPPKHLFTAARVLHAVGYLRDPQYTVEQVAEQAGYQNPRVMTQHTLAVFGARPSQLRTLSEDETLAAILVWTRLKQADQIST